MSVKRLVAVLALTGLAVPAVSAQTTVNEFWPEVDAYIRLNSSMRFFLLAAPVRAEGAEQFGEAQLGAHLEVGIAPIGRALIRKIQDPDKYRFLRLRVGYRQAFAQDSSGIDLSERRVIAELTPRAFVPGGILVTLRNRFDFRWLEDDYSWRYRPRIWLERETDIGPTTVIPYASAEVFWDSRFESWSRTRYQGGLAVPVAHWLVPEVYYAYQIDREPALRYLNALGLVATLYF